MEEQDQQQEDKIIITAKGVDYEVKPLVFVEEQTLAPWVKFVVVLDEETDDYIEIGRKPLLITEANQQDAARSEKEVLEELAVSLRMQLSLRAKKSKKVN